MYVDYLGKYPNDRKSYRWTEISDLFRLLYRISPNKMVKEGYKYTDETLFIDHYGRKKKRRNKV